MSESKIKPLTAPAIPKHVAVIMDGNGRWAKARRRPRFMGHKAGVESVRSVVNSCVDSGVEVLTLFAFSSENWRRPEEEVGALMSLFATVLEREVKKLHKSNVSLRIIGELNAFTPKMQKLIEKAESLTANNTGLTLVIAANYGGRWDITQATRQLAHQVERGELSAADINPEMVAQVLSLSDLPEPDLFIRTGGEQRISNFLLWQLAYTELYFTDTLWPDFKEEAFNEALLSFSQRQRRFGKTGDQIEQGKK